ncbi:MAG: hypothetical protein ACT6S0_14765 [Roseateles sp.]|uniref:hypothetical protein n=1 Tax=Roseateles sp. TaxID=1971397 RepID=UPI00403692B4
MRLKKVSLRWIASMLATLLVFLQLATAAYACAAPQTAAGESAMAAMSDCEAMASMDPEQPQLCKAHCDRDKQTVNNAPVPDVAPAALLDRLLSRLALWLPPGAAEALPAVVAAHTGPPDGAPPVYLALQVLRI